MTPEQIKQRAAVAQEFVFGTPALDALHRSLRAPNGTYANYAEYVVLHRSLNGSKDFRTLNITYIGQVVPASFDIPQ